MMTEGLEKYFFGCLVILAATYGCQKTDTLDQKPPPKSPDVHQSANFCSICGLPAGGLHKCGETIYCDICKRDAYKYFHYCGKTDICLKCHREIGKNHICGITFICTSDKCRKDYINDIVEVGPNHICGLTKFCSSCQRDAIIETHICGISSLCPVCKIEVTEQHICGLSKFCSICKNERSLDTHICGSTAFCKICRAERPITHKCQK